MASIFNLEQQLTFYASYHNNKINQLIHIIFVPTIVWTVLVWTSNTVLIPNYSFTLANAITAFYSSYYFSLEPFATLFYAPILIGLNYAAVLFVQNVPNAISYSIGIHVASWIFQFIGHGVFEGRSPALFDNLFQAFALAPLFVWLEVLFTVVNYRPALQKSLKNKVAKEIKKFKQKKQ